MRFLPKVFLVGGPDVDARLDLMHCLNDDFDLTVLGSVPILRDRFRAEGFNYIPYRLNRGINPLSDLLTVGQLASIFRKLKPHIVHAFDTKPGVWGCLAARLAGVPVVIGTLTGFGGSLYENDDLKNRLVRSFYEQLQTLACRFSDLSIFQNEDDARQCVATGVASGEKTKVILGSGVSTDFFAPDRVSLRERERLRSELRIQPDEIVVTMISRLIRSKGVLEFMNAARAVHLNYPHVRFLLVGPEDSESIDRLDVAELTELKQTVIWPGPRRDIPAVLAISDIFAFPTAHREGIPRVLMEAASMGLPIVTTDASGCNEVVDNGINGFLTPVHDVNALSHALLRLIKQPELRERFGDASRRRMMERFDLSIIARQTRSVYWQLLARKGLSHAVEPWESTKPLSDSNVERVDHD